MTGTDTRPRLLVLTADRHSTVSVRTLLDTRRRALGIRRLEFRILRHPESDPGCRKHAVEEVRPYLRRFDRLVVVFDHAGCGSADPPEQIERTLEDVLARNGWRDRVKVIVVAPELEAWIWGRSEAVARVLGWEGGFAALRTWLAEQGLWPPGDPKPPDPKRAAERVLGRRGTRLTADLFRELASRASFRDCRDPAFCALRDTLREWYPAGDEP